MGLSCITTYKLDALKSVCQKGESTGTTPLHSREDVVSLTTVNLESLNSQMELLSTNNVDGVDINHAEKRKYLECFDIHYLHLWLFQLFGVP